MATNMINARIVARFGSDFLMCCGSVVAAIAGCLLLVDGVSGFGGLWGLVIPLDDVTAADFNRLCVDPAIVRRQ